MHKKLKLPLSGRKTLTDDLHSMLEAALKAAVTTGKNC
jgi:hypothetical protein